MQKSSVTAAIFVHGSKSPPLFYAGYPNEHSSKNYWSRNFRGEEFLKFVKNDNDDDRCQVMAIVHMACDKVS